VRVTEKKNNSLLQKKQCC